MAQRWIPGRQTFAHSPTRAILLAVALLLGQLGLIAHASEHALQPDHPVCQLCVHAHSGAVGQVACALPPSRLADEQPLILPQAAPRPAPASIYGARAPPA